MGALAVAVAGPDHGAAVHGEARGVLAVPGVGDVGGAGLAVGGDDADVLVEDAAAAGELDGEPEAVGRPTEPVIAVGIRVVLIARERDDGFLRFDVEDADLVAVVEVADFLAIGRVGGLELLRVGGDEGLLVDLGGAEEVEFVLVGDGGLVDVPRAVALARVDDRTTIGREVDGAFLLGRVGDAAGCGEFGRGHEDIAADDEGDLFAALGDGEVRRAGTLAVAARVCGDIDGDGDVEFLGGAAAAHDIDVAVPGERGVAVVGE